MIKKNYPANTPERKNLTQQAECRIYICHHRGVDLTS